MFNAKVLGIIGILLAVVVALGIYTSKSLNTTSKRLEYYTDNIEQHVQSGDWNQTKESLSSLEKDWNNSQKIWSTLIDHIELDNINASLSRAAKYIESGDKALTLGEIANLRQFIKHIPERESFNLKNIL